MGADAIMPRNLLPGEHAGEGFQLAPAGLSNAEGGEGRWLLIIGSPAPRRPGCARCRFASRDMPRCSGRTQAPCARPTAAGHTPDAEIRRRAGVPSFANRRPRCNTVNAQGTNVAPSKGSKVNNIALKMVL